MKLLNLFLAAIIIFTISSCEEQQQASQQQERADTPKVTHQHTKTIAAPPRHDTLCIAAAGDIMLGTTYPDSLNLPPDSARQSFTAVAHYLNGNDVTFGNLEGTLLDGGDPAHYKLHLKSKAWLFRMPSCYGMVLKNAGFNVLSTANNHVGDFGDAGRQSTMHLLDSLQIHYAGLLSHPADTFSTQGVKYGFCAFSPNSGVETLLDLPNAIRIIQQLKQQCDVVIVAYHGGGEGVGYEHVPCAMESFHGEKRGDVHMFAHSAIDAGADVVLGTGPHVSRAVEVYKDRFIAYSLGNFCTYRSVSVSGICGIAPLLKIYVNKKGQFLNARIISVKQTHDGGLQPDSLNSAAKRIRMLTLSDFPQSGISIDDNGFIAKNAMQADSVGAKDK